MQVLILGFDSFDPNTFEQLSAIGKVPNLTRYVEAGKYARFEVSDPPQTEVSWTSIATGLNPGGHGIFDFVHREPKTYSPFVSLLPTQRKALGVQFVPPYKARTIFEEATRLGYPATSLWWPATFPARPEIPVRTIPGLGTPDIMGKLGVGTLYTTDEDQVSEENKTSFRLIKRSGSGRYTATIEGPASQKGDRLRTASIEMQVELNDSGDARLIIGKQSIPLSLGTWSDIFEVSFKMGFFYSLRAITRAILTQSQPDIRIYFLPLQIHPLASPWWYATPPSLAKETWKSAGAYLSLGWPQDTTALEEGCISDEQFLSLCDLIFSSRERTLMRWMQSFNEGIMGIVFDSLDRVQHMFRRDRPELIESWYIKLDALVGRVEQRLLNKGNSHAKLLVLSDHGFTDFNYKVNLNRWLVDHGYIVPISSSGTGGLSDVDWSRSQVYAVGLNSLYINLAGREGQGSVAPDQVPSLSDRLMQQLLEWRGPDGRSVVQRALLNDDVFNGPLKEFGPDLLVGYSPGYRASSETGLGKWIEAGIELNNDHWGADHCIDSQAVPGVLFSSAGLGDFSEPSYRDIPQLTIGKEIEQSEDTPPPPPSISSGEEKDILEERLKSLGYL